MATITSFSPTAATPGQKVSINGTGFTGATAVLFGGVNALFFIVKSDILIEAYPNFTGTNIVTVTTTAGDVALPGFTLLLTKVRLIDLPQLGRDVQPDDLQYVWDIVRSKLCQAPNSAFPAGDGTGGGGTGGTTALGSPFKVKSDDIRYTFDTDLNSSIIYDVRLLGKIGYVVYGTDVSNEFEDYMPPATPDNATTAPDGILVNQSADTLTGSGSSASYTIETVNNVVTKLIQTGLGTGYVIGDTFTIASLPGIVFTVTSITGGSGRLIYDQAGGGFTIVNYELTPGSHITVYADGVVNNQFDSISTKIEVYDQLLKPLLTLGGIVLPWRKPASTVPIGWQECTDFRGKILIGQDPGDTYNSTTNPEGLSQPIGTVLGNRKHTLTEPEIPVIQIQAKTNPSGAGSFWPFRVGPGYNPTLENQHTIGGGLAHSVLNPVRIVEWIEYVGLGAIA